MEPIIDFFAASGVDFWLMLKTCGIILLCVLLAGLLGKFLFGKKSRINHAVTAAVSIVFLYLIAALLRTVGSQMNWLIAPLPFTQISGDTMVLFSFQNVAASTLCGELLSMALLSFLVNLANNWMPRGRRFMSWLGFRFLTIVAGWGGYLFIDWLSNLYLPGAFLLYAPQILLVLLVILILVGALKLLVGVLLASVNPVIAALYTFFFANIVGRQITKALFTTGLLAGLVILLRSLGVVTLSLGSGAIIAYLPFMLILLSVWYPINRKI